MDFVGHGSLGSVNQDYIDRKERWARKMAGKEPKQKAANKRLPPGQHEVRNFPVLDLGVRPQISLEEWRLHIHGQVENPVKLRWADFMSLPQFSDVSDFHCVTTWSQLGMEWRGVSFFALAELVRPKPEAKHLLFKGYDGYSTNNPIEVCLDDDVLIAHSWNGRPLSREHGGPARVILPKRYAWKGAKFIREIVFTSREVLGFWELKGYSNTANPWKNDRFAESSLP